MMVATFRWLDEHNINKIIAFLRMSVSQSDKRLGGISFSVASKIEHFTSCKVAQVVVGSIPTTSISILP